MERTMRTRTLLLAAATLVGVASSCTGWLLDWTGTSCDVDDDCGGGLRCRSGTCQQPGSSPAEDAGLDQSDAGPSSDDGGAPASDAASSAPVDAGEGADASGHDAGPRPLHHCGENVCSTR
jgi:hypothetical protein